MTRLEHIGIAVDDAALVENLFARLLGYTPYKRERVDSEGVQTIFFDAGSTKLELLATAQPGSAIARHLERRGEGLHHLAFEVPDIHAEMERLRALGFNPLNETPKRGADHKLIFFLHPKETHGVLVEFCQSTPYVLPTRRFPFEGGSIDLHEGGPEHTQPLLILDQTLWPSPAALLPLLNRLEQSNKVYAFAPPQEALLSPALKALLNHAGSSQAALLGYRWSAAAAYNLAQTCSGAVSSLVLVAPVLSAQADLRTCAVPTLMLFSDTDQDDRLTQALAAHQANPLLSLAVLPGSPHALIETKHALVADLIQGHLR